MSSVLLLPHLLNDAPRFSVQLLLPPVPHFESEVLPPHLLKLEFPPSHFESENFVQKKISGKDR
jgi:hypothetical protein